MKGFNSARRQRGLSLVELMVSLVLGLLLSLGVVNIFISSKSSYQQQTALSELQENARFALDFIARDLRMAGYSGCSSEMSVANSVSGAPGFFGNFGDGLTGYDGDAGTVPADFPDALADTDAVIIHTSMSGDEFSVTNHNSNSAQIDIVGTHTIPAGSILMIVDANCTSQGIFTMTGPNSGTKNNAVHNTGNTFSYGTSNVGNCTKALKGNFTCADRAGELQNAYSDGSSLFRIRTIGYYIRDPAGGATLSSPTLYRVNFSNSYTGGSSANDVQPLVEGIADFNLLYGVPDGNKMQFQDAATITAADNWDLVEVVRVEVTAQSLTAVEGAPLQQQFVRTVKIRNRG